MRAVLNTVLAPVPAVPSNKALKLTGHCYDLDRRGSPAA